MDACEKIINFGRTCIVSNEEQYLATVLSYVSAYASSDSQYISTIIVGESAGGKTHLNKQAVALLDPATVKNITSGSEKSFIYDDDLRDDKIKFINGAELQKLTTPMLEYFKALSGDDGDFSYTFTDMGKHGTEEITQPKRPYTFTYAQVEIDKELKTRVFIIPVTENIDVNRCVAALKLGARTVEYRGRTYGATSDEVKEELKTELQCIINSLSLMPMDVAIDFPFALIDMVNHSRPESKRHAQLISSLISSSCRLNYDQREIRDGKLVASAQDIVNMMSMFGLLQATMMGIDMIDSLMYKYISKMPRCSPSAITGHLVGLGFGELTRTEMERRLHKLHDENYIERETTTQGMVYYVNSSKQILSIQVDWNEIHKHDTSQVKDPLTSIEYNDILEYGEMISTMHQIVSPDISDEGTEEDIDEHKERDALIVDAIMAILDDGTRYTHGMLSSKASGLVEGATSFDVMPIITRLHQERVIDRSDHDEKYGLRK